MTTDVVRDLIGGGIIAANRPVAEKFGLTTAVLLHELAFWCRMAESNGEAWGYRTQEEIRQATCLSDERQLSARRKLSDAGILIEERRGLPARLYFRIDWDQLATSLGDNSGSLIPKNSDTGSRETRIHSLRASKKEQVENIPGSDSSKSPGTIHLGDQGKAEQSKQAEKEMQAMYRQWFDAIAKHYPDHRRDTDGNNPAWRAYRELMAPQGVPLSPQDAHQLALAIRDGLADWLEYEGWEKDEGKYVPKLSNFLSRGTWGQNPE